MELAFLLVVFVSVPVLFTLGVLGSWRNVLEFWRQWLLMIGAMVLVALVLSPLVLLAD